MHIIDIGTGNACWLLELASQSPPTWRLQGVDISSLNYPADEYLPKNVSLSTLDVFGEIPNDMVNKFDVVHIRTFALIITHSEPMPLLKNLVNMLSGIPPLSLSKPGCYLQWDEFDCSTLNAHAPNPHTGKKSCDELLRLWQLFARKTGLDFRWVSELSSSFNTSNLQVVDSLRLPPIDDLRKATTDNFMVGFEEIGGIAAGKSSELLGSHEEFRELFRKAIEETQQGVSLGLDMVEVVGRKPTDSSCSGS
ncbi:hypothetical protein IMSHALPRED_000534 [Imshaugia aleurites]|uniref:Methyltransferase domain-containing protein n=1 Tax=Imshaugia aleurites TaxID=172621 RepID=A0A8H3G7U5_9LECA|nr:hypothetical protein IMSHALPRED_000534 [Imshaugia aleurites]